MNYFREKMGMCMHILFISDGDDRYGASNSMKQLIAELLRQNENLKISVILLWRSGMQKEFEELGCEVHKVFYESFYQALPYSKWKIPVKYVLRGVEYWIGRFFGVRSAGRRIDMESVDIIHANSSREDFSALLAGKYQKPLIWHIREFGDKDYKCFSYRKDYISFMNERATEMITVSDAVKRHWIKKGLRKDKICRIYNGVNSFGIPEKEYGKRKTGVFRFIILGAICKTKGQYQIIEACGKMRPHEKEKIRIDIVGGGTEAYIKEIRKRIHLLGLDSYVRIFGYQKDFNRKLGEYDCGLMCSKSEGFGRVTVEYMMSGIPVIASDTGANRELVNHGENGWIYHWNDVLDLKGKMLYAAEHIGETEQMGRNAREIAMKYFSVQLNAELIYKEYLNIWNGR